MDLRNPKDSRSRSEPSTTDDPPRRRRLSLRWRLFIGLFVLAAVTILHLAGRVVFYQQVDDEQHLASKNAYLEQLEQAADLSTRAPNLVFILFDDLGYGDIGAYGGEAIATPNLDRLASDGLLFRDAYSPSPYCSASRAGWLTGRYAVRSGLDHVLQAPWDWQDVLIRFGGLNRRLPAEEITLAEVLQAAGYDTAIVGKWHLGDESPSLPTDMGFDAFYGLLFSNDQGKPVVWENSEIVEEHPIEQSTLTRRYTERAVAFIEAQREGPFFLYLPHTFPHVPLEVSTDRLGQSDAGLYGDVVEELDWSTGAIMDALDRAGVASNTLVVVSSDNGPWYQGSPGGMRGRKFDVFEAGMRVPLLVRWPGHVKGGRNDATPVVGVDLFPTMLDAAKLPLPDDRFIDGESILGRLRGSGTGYHGPIWFHQIDELRAVRDGRFKLHDRHSVPHGNPPDFPVALHVQKGPWLFDLENDPSESYDVTHRYPEVAQRMADMIETRRLDSGANPRGWR